MNGAITLACVLAAAGATYWCVGWRVRRSHRRARQELLSRESHYQALYDRAPDMMASVDTATWCVLVCNQTLADALGRAKAEIVGRSVLECFSPGSAADAGRVFERVFDAGEVHNAEVVLARRDGTTIDTNLNIATVHDAEGRIVHARAVWQDITDRKLAEHRLRESLREAELVNAELAFHKFALDQHAIVAVTDPKGRITYVNDKFCQISRYPREELLGQDHRIINSGHHPKAFFRDMYATIAAGRVWHGEIRNRAKDGSIYWVDTTIVPFMDAHDAVARYVAIRADITERKQTQERLGESFLRQQDLLKREITLVRELNHRVRNNLAGILGLVGTYERSAKDARAIGEAVRAKVRALKEVHDMISLSHDLPVDLRRLVERLAADAAEGTGPARPGRVILDGRAVLVPAAQACALAMILQELLTNAVKHGALSGPQGSVRLTWSVGADDTGPTLALEWHERGGPPTRPPASRGAGLGIIEGLVGAELRGQCEFHFEPAGLRVEIRARLDRPDASRMEEGSALVGAVDMERSNG